MNMYFFYFERKSTISRNSVHVNNSTIYSTSYITSPCYQLQNNTDRQQTVQLVIKKGVFLQSYLNYLFLKLRWPIDNFMKTITLLPPLSIF